MSENETDNLTNLTALLCEDEAIIQMQLQRALRRNGVVIVGNTGSGTEAVTLAALHRPDLILMDVGLEGMNGWDAAQQIMNASGDYSPCIIMLTGASQADVAAGMERVGARGVIQKPTVASELIVEIRRCYEEHLSSVPCAAD